ncbi:MAG: transcription termination/antitermination factor NusG [Candidatus Omnitrophica bacterium]|nr:transcription termination/antitermination factor NusG [Candidatus Omnitrophota bacterium]
MEWYVIHTQTGAEDRAKAGIDRRIQTTDLKKYVEELVVPTEQVSEVRGGKKRITTRKFFPGYLLIKMEMTKESWYLIKTTPGVTSFIGPGRQPQKLSDQEVNNILKRTVDTESRPSPKVSFDLHEPVRITQGPFANFNGTVTETYPERGKLKVSVPVFGRATLVELEYWQVEKV